MDDFHGEVRGLIISLGDHLSSEECAEAEHLLDHGEPGEALRALAWMIVEEEKRVPARQIDAIERLADGLVAPEDMPPDLRAHVS